MPLNPAAQQKKRPLPLDVGRRPLYVKSTKRYRSVISEPEDVARPRRSRSRRAAAARAETASIQEAAGRPSRLGWPKAVSEHRRTAGAGASWRAPCEGSTAGT